MKQSIKKLLALTLIMIVAVSMAVTTPLSAGAITGTAEIVKEVKVPGGVTMPTGSYEFVFTPITVKNSTTLLPPNVNNDTTNDNKIVLTFDGTETPVVAGGYNVYTRNNTAIFADTTFPHAGIYVYEVEETASTLTTVPAGYTMTYSQAKYSVEVYVENDGSGGLNISNFVVTEVNNQAGTPTGVKPLKMVFENTYSSDTQLAVSKQVKGNFADQTKDFTYTINIAGALTPSVDARHIDATGASTMISIPAAGGTFTLKHDESIIFESLPVGATYVLTESGESGYTASAKVADGGGVTLGTETGAAGAAVTVGGAPATTLNTPIALVNGTNTADWENAFSDTVATGVLMNMLPFIVLIIVAVGGFVGFVVMRRRKLNQR